MPDQPIPRRLQLLPPAPEVPKPFPQPELVRLGGVVRALRQRARLSQDKLADLADLGRNYIGVIERGEVNPTFRTLLRLSKGFGVPLSRLMAYVDGSEAIPLFGAIGEGTDGRAA